jgi:MoaA/NifB/PqqE/SkfB family radical SAM enzyme
VEKTSGRLIVTYKCFQSCAGCCNRNWKGDLPKKITFVQELKQYEEILITGGEPLLFVSNLMHLIERMRKHLKSRIILYTAAPSYADLKRVAPLVDGLTVTIHTDADVDRFNMAMSADKIVCGSSRLNIFHKDIKHLLLSTDIWCRGFSRKDVEWRENCPLPPNEELLKLDPTWM